MSAFPAIPPAFTSSPPQTCSWVVSTDLLRARLVALVQARPCSDPQAVMEVLEGRIRFAVVNVDPNTVDDFEGASVDVDYDVSSASEVPKPFRFRIDLALRRLHQTSLGPKTEITWDGDRLSFSDPSSPLGEFFVVGEPVADYEALPSISHGITARLLFDRNDMAELGKRLGAMTARRERLRDGYVQISCGGGEIVRGTSFHCPDRTFLLTTTLKVGVGIVRGPRPPEWVTIPAWFFQGMAIDAASLKEFETLELDIQDQVMIYRGRTIRIHRESYSQTVVDTGSLIRSLGFASHGLVCRWIVSAERFVETLAKYQSMLRWGGGIRVTVGASQFAGATALELRFSGRGCGAIERLPLVMGHSLVDHKDLGMFDLDLLLRCSRHGARGADSRLGLSLSPSSGTLRIMDVSKDGDISPLTAYIAPVTDGSGYDHDD